MRRGLLRGVVVAGREGREALVLAICGLGCGLQQPVSIPDMFSFESLVDARGESVCAPTPGTRVPLGSKPLRHQVAPGETLAGLARWYGVSVTALARENRISDPDRIAAGSWLRIPAGARAGCPPPTLVARAAPARPANAAAPVSAPAPRTPPRVEAEASHEEARRMLVRAQSRYDAADFGEALEFASASLHLLEPYAGEPEADRLRANGSWISGLAYTGLGRSQSAIASFRTALDLDASLADAGPISPKVRTLVDLAGVP